MLFGEVIRKRIRKEKGSHTYACFAAPPEGQRKEAASRKASLCIFRRMRKGSFTVEAALALPLFLFGVVCMISFQDLYREEAVCRAQLCEAVKSAGLAAGVAGGADQVILADTYSLQPAGGLLPPVRKTLLIRARAWTGKAREGGTLEDTPAEEMVYITASGSKYHSTPACSAINKGVESIPGSSLVNGRYGGKTYSACGVCSAGQTPAAVVYITKSGNRFHNNGSCSTIGQTAMMIRKSEAGGRGPCSLCCR